MARGMVTWAFFPSRTSAMLDYRRKSAGYQMAYAEARLRGIRLAMAFTAMGHARRGGPVAALPAPPYRAMVPDQIDQCGIDPGARAGTVPVEGYARRATALTGSGPLVDRVGLSL